MPDVIEKLGQQGVAVQAEGPAEFRAFIRSETEKYKAIVEAAGIHS